MDKVNNIGVNYKSDKDKLTHFDDNGNAVMVDVSDKEETVRVAIAKGRICVNEKVMDAVLNHRIEKGDVLAVARVAGIMAAKQTSSLIPMCHPLFINKCSIDFEIDKESNSIYAICTTKIKGLTGVEMESLTGVTIALLTIYDMCKALDKNMEILDVYVAKKTGGKSGEFLNERWTR